VKVITYAPNGVAAPSGDIAHFTAVGTHLAVSFGPTLMHSKLGHHRMGGRLFRNRINFHHTCYSNDHPVLRTSLGKEGHNTPFFFIPVFVVGGYAYFLLPLNLFVVLALICAVSFYADVFSTRSAT
jgi:hypothetical protein